MKLLIHIHNVLNYVILLFLIIFNLHKLSQIGINHCEYFILSSAFILIISLTLYLLKKKEIFLVSVFINIFNLIIVFPILLPFLLVLIITSYSIFKIGLKKGLSILISRIIGVFISCISVRLFMDIYNSSGYFNPFSTDGFSLF